MPSSGTSLSFSISGKVVDMILEQVEILSSPEVRRIFCGKGVPKRLFDPLAAVPTTFGPVTVSWRVAMQRTPPSRLLPAAGGDVQRQRQSKRSPHRRRNAPDTQLQHAGVS